MELTGLLQAIGMATIHGSNQSQVTILCDSQYAVDGANEWRQKWKKQGWNKKAANSPKRGPSSAVKNVGLWVAIDEALECVPSSTQISIRWIKGHCGIAGNERADELAELGRQHAAGRLA
jgi:ribonuclease HI